MRGKLTLSLLAVTIVMMALTPALPTCGGEPSEKKLVPLPLKLPYPIGAPTPPRIPQGPHIPPRNERRKLRPPFMAPAGAKVLSRGKTVTASDDNPIIGYLEQVTDGDKEGADGSYIEFFHGLQYVQVDLEASRTLVVIAVWHYFMGARVYHDVIVQVSDDPEFCENVQTLFNNDFDNSAGFGIGKQRPYFDTFQGLLVDAKSVRARYVRCYSNGSTTNNLNHIDDMNQIIEVEVWGMPVKK